MHQTQIISFLVNHPQFAQRLLSQNYPFSLQQLKRYGSVLAWGLVSANTNIGWSSQILWQCNKQLDWECVSINPSAFPSIDMLSEFDAFIDWQGNEGYYGDSIASNPGLPWTDELIRRLEHKINFVKLSANESVQWSNALIDRYKGRWELSDLASNESVPWTLPLFERHLNESYFFYFGVSTNPALLRNIDLVEKYSQKMEWWAVFANSQLPWIEKRLLERWRQHINWYGLSQNEFFFRTDKDFFTNNMDRWMENEGKGFVGLSSNRYLPWSTDFIDRYLPLWQWNTLCENEFIPWDEKMIDHFAKHIEWGGTKPGAIYNDYGEVLAPTGGFYFEFGLIDNKNLPWSLDLLKRYESQINLDDLSEHSHIWEKAFMPYIDDNVLDTVLRII